MLVSQTSLPGMTATAKRVDEKRDNKGSKLRKEGFNVINLQNFGQLDILYVAVIFVLLSCSEIFVCWPLSCLVCHSTKYLSREVVPER